MDYITKSKRGREIESFSKAFRRGARIVSIRSKKKNKFDEWKTRNWGWLKRLPTITVVLCLALLALSDYIDGCFYILNIAAYIGMGLLTAMYLWVFHYLLTTRLISIPEQYEWLTYSIFWSIIAIIIWYVKHYYVFSQ